MQIKSQADVFILLKDENSGKIYLFKSSSISESSSTLSVKTLEFIDKVSNSIFNMGQSVFSLFSFSKLN